MLPSSLPICERTLRAVLLDRARQYPIVTVTGPRQSGKTTLCRSAFPQLPWVSLEAPDVRAQAVEDPRGLLRQYPDGALIDEVQRAPELLSYLQDDVDRRTEVRGRWILTGSHNLLLLKAVSQSLAGRTAVLNLLPLALQELPAAWLHDLPWTHLALAGGYPGPLHRGIPLEIWLGDYVATYLERDVRDVLRVADLRSFERFVRLCAGRSGQLLNLASLGADAGIAHSTAKAWLSVLEATFVTFMLQPWSANLTTREVRSPKLFFWDTGLLCWLLGIRRAEDVALHPLRGAIFENMVAVELLKHDLHRGRRPQWWFYRDAKGLEIDFVQVDGLRVRGMEVKSGETLQQAWADPLRTWRERLMERGQDPQMAVVYGGEGRGAVRGAEGLPWRGIGEWLER